MSNGIKSEPPRNLIHERVEAARAGTNPTVVCRVPSGWVVLGDNQLVRGYCIPLSDPVVPDLNSLKPTSTCMIWPQWVTRF
jgi:hypothetical protein